MFRQLSCWLSLFFFVLATVLTAWIVLFPQMKNSAQHGSLKVEEPNRVLRNLPFGQEYTVAYRVQNSGSRPLRVLNVSES